MNYLYLFLLAFYIVVPPLVLFFTLKLIYKDKNAYGQHIHSLAKYLVTLSFLPLLFFPDLDLGLVPNSYLSVFLIILTVVLAIFGISPAIKRGKLFLYIGGIYAGFMEEILYRGIIFALSMAIWDNIWITLFITSLSFGIWHLKNYYWCGKRKIIVQFLYTSLFYGPLFFVARIITGDIYLAVLMHYLVDTWVTFFPNWIGNRLINNDDPIYKDDFIIKP